MNDKCIWYLSDGTSLKGKAAEDYILSRQKKLDQLIKKADHLLNEMKKFNTSKTVIGDEEADNDTSRLMETLENLSVEETLCETLLEKLQGELHND